MQELRLVAVSEDGTYLVLATPGRGTRFTLPVDDRLRAAVRGNFSRLGQYEIEVESPLRPKEIQARIRAGETAEEIAATAGIPVERVRWFEGPVLQEREYMAQQAQRVPIRMPGDNAPGPLLGDLVRERLARRGVPVDEIDWDSCKRDDNLWRVRLGFVWNGHTRHAEWLFDPRRRHIVPNDEEARRLSSPEYEDPEPEEETATIRPFLPRITPKLSPVPPLPDERDPARRPVRPEPVEEQARPQPIRPELPAWPNGGGDPYRGQPGPVPFRLPDPLVQRDGHGLPGPVQDEPPVSPAAVTAGPPQTGAASSPAAPADGEPAGGSEAAAQPPAVPAPRPGGDQPAPGAAATADGKDAADSPAPPAPSIPANFVPPASAVPANGGTGAAGDAKEAKPETPAPPVPKPRPRKSRARRTPVPSWDEIMFGTRRQD